MLENLKVAIVHDWLTGMRGGEKCLEIFCEIFPEADLYTLLYKQGRLSHSIEKMNIKTSFIQKLPYGIKHYRYYLALFPAAIESFNLDGYDLIISSSHCVAKGISYKNAYHISYIHAPMRYIWGLYDLYFSPEKASFPVRTFAGLIRPYLQNWDRNSANKVHTFICNSQYVKQQVRDIYQRDSHVIYPPVDLSRFSPNPPKEDYYLIAGAFAPNKQVDLAIKAFNKLQYPLKIVGLGQEEKYCRKIARSNIEFLGNVSDEELLKLYQKAKAFVFPGIDDFGITPLEAQASGTPVVAYAKGGVLESVNEKTGIFFHEPTIDSLVYALQKMEKSCYNFDPYICSQNAVRFGQSREKFKQEIVQIMQSEYQKWLKQVKK